ncbi:AraC family transcriptional regulator [Bradyrhizobium sp. UFLA05-109]
MFKTSDEQAIECPASSFHPSDAEDVLRVLLMQPVAVSSVDPASATPSLGYVRGGLPPRVVRRLREHIDANIEHRISVEALARLANLSVCYFVRAFKQSMGLTPHDYLIRRRVERTKELLSETDLSLSEIALAAGFADQSHCARRFRQHVGMSPRDYRWSVP